MDEVTPVTQAAVQVLGARTYPHNAEPRWGRGEDALARARKATEAMGLGDVGGGGRRVVAVLCLDDDERAPVADPPGQVGALEDVVLPPGHPIDAGAPSQLAGPVGARRGGGVAELEVQQRGDAILHD